MRRTFVLAAFLASIVVGPAWSQPAPKVPILLDTDIGGDMEDPFALALILASPELDLRGITTVSGPTNERALLVCRFLTMTGRRHFTVAAGANPQPEGELGKHYQYYYHPDVLFNRTRRPEKESAVDYLYARLKGQQGKITIVATGPLTNIARLITEKPEAKALIKRIVFHDSSTKGASATNVLKDLKAARTVFASGVPLVVMPWQRTCNFHFSSENCAKMFKPGTALSLQVQALYQLYDREGAGVGGDALAVAYCFEERFVKTEALALQVTDEGLLRKVDAGKPNALLVNVVEREEFVTWFTERMASCVAPADRPAKLMPQGNLPNRVHVAEDYDNDIERRWWMSGKEETKNLPPGSKRACRGVLTHDFDDLLGHTKAMYTAVVFNPVPGPPMGKNPRLSFRYWLQGTDTMRVQIYSLTNGYHRHLVLKGLPEGKWQAGTVDMNVARRPDGTGGPLSEGERIDDIQFYIDHRADLIIDDVYLYDAAPAEEKRPFPKRIYFSGLFDSGKQGQHWPGEFDIVQDKGYYWHAARSVTNKETGRPWIRMGLRGEREMGAVPHVSFRYHATGADSVVVSLVNKASGRGISTLAKGLTKERWSQATVNFSDAVRAGERFDEVHFLLPAGADLLIDDVLLYEP